MRCDITDYLQQIKYDAKGVPYASAQQLNNFATAVINEFSPDVLKEPDSVRIEDLAEFHCHANLEIRSITQDKSILGATLFNGGCIKVYDDGWTPVQFPKRTILIEEDMKFNKQIGRYRFTLAHEISHLLLHSGANCSTGTISRNATENETVIMCRPGESISNRTKPQSTADWLEWQADRMAAALLMPEPTFKYVVEVFMKNSGAGSIAEIKYMIDKNWSNVTDELLFKLGQIFEVSKTAARYRLRDCGYSK